MLVDLKFFGINTFSIFITYQENAGHIPSRNFRGVKNPNAHFFQHFKQGLLSTLKGEGAKKNVI
jgi:hypothetical protein